MEMKSKRVIVTGGAGFIGSHLVSRLVSLGEDVTVIDKAIEPGSFFSVAKLDKNVHIERVDIGDRQALSRALLKYPDAFIFHLAAETIVSECYDRPWDTMQTNIMGTVNLLEAVRTSPSISGMIVASSDKAYGKTKQTYTESSPLAGDHPYDVSKSSADLIAIAYAITYGTPVAVTRFGNVYGEGDMHLDRLIPGICEAVAKKKELVLRSDGTYIRDYVYVKDVVSGYLLLRKQFEQAKGEAFNFSSRDHYSVLQVIELAEQTLGTKIPYSIANTAKNEIPYQHLDDSKMRKLGWKNTYSMKTILPDIYEWYRKHI